ncbi:hypothetical protein [Desulfuromonas sp. CSMB_57]|uniref:hypothetical protein n=1 Tax=Desulfuromonas sp. CSMB_57 TaxID=2807629 RepID=UPI0020BE0471|nr:hypothetical protein [Desulfuromonas sp. CSMB_57]
MSQIISVFQFATNANDFQTKSHQMSKSPAKISRGYLGLFWKKGAKFLPVHRQKTAFNSGNA